MIYENISKYHCRVSSFFLIIRNQLLFIFNQQGILIALKYEGQQLIYKTRFFRGI